MTMPGLETLAFSEVRARVPDAELVKFARGIAIFRTAVRPGDLMELRTVEDVFVTLTHITGLGHGRGALRVLYRATLNADLDSTLALWRRVHKVAKPRTWRVISQQSGSHEFRRIDAEMALREGLSHVLPRSIRHVLDDAELEFWLWMSGSEALVGLRLSDATMRHRTYKREHLPASLRPTVAAAMGWLTRPAQEDIVLDPLCGAGTVLIERALLAPLKEALGGDIRCGAVETARRNARSAGIEASWRVWDARSLPLEAASVTRIITNLPFGKQIGTHEANVDLYSKLIREFGRVLGADGVLVTLTSDDRLWDSLLRERDWQVIKKVVLVVLGQPASIFVAEQA
jgi:tRNA (guanine6-N2)-methyltransferase